MTAANPELSQYCQSIDTKGQGNATFDAGSEYACCYILPW